MKELFTVTTNHMNIIFLTIVAMSAWLFSFLLGYSLSDNTKEESLTGKEKILFVMSIIFIYLTARGI